MVKQHDPCERALTISPEKLAFVIARAREFEFNDAIVDADSTSNRFGAENNADLEDHPEQPIEENLASFINSLPEAEQIDLMALAKIGRDDYSAYDWPAVRLNAASSHSGRMAEYLLGIPLLADCLEEGLSTMGFRSCGCPQ